MPVDAEAEVTIERPPAAVFAVLADVTHHPEWASAVSEVHSVVWRDGGVGSTFEQVTSALGRTVISRVTVTDFEQDARFAARTTGPVPARMVWDLTPTPTGSGTRVRMSLHVDPGSLGGLVASLMRSRVHQQMVEDLQRLKSRVESAH